MPSQQNQDQLQVIKDKLSQSQSVILAEYAGLSVAAQTKLRATAKEVGGEFTVQKNRLLKIALKERLKDLPENLVEALNGPTAVLYGLKDAVSSVKALVTFAKENEALKIKLGILTGDTDKVLSAKEVDTLSKLPSKEQLIVSLMRAIQGPTYSLVNVLSAPARNLVYALKAVQDKKSN